MKTTLSAWLIAVSTLAFAATAAAQESEELNLAENLDRIIADGQGHELFLRMVKFGLEINVNQLDRDRQARFACSLAPAGGHLEHLVCNENGVLRHLEEAGTLTSEPPGKAAAQLFPIENVGGEYVSEHPVTPGALEQAMQTLGPTGFNRQLVLAVLKGNSLPDNTPGIKELNQFASALTAVRGIQSSYGPKIAEARASETRQELIAESDRMMIQAIEESGLAVERYNEISMLVEQYPSLLNYVRERL